MTSEELPADSKCNKFRTSGIQLKINRKILWAMGLWYPRKARASQYRDYWLFSWFMTFGLFAHISTEIVAMYVYSNDIRIMLNIFCTMISGLGAFYKALYTVYRKYQMQDLVNKLEGSTFAFDHQIGEEQQRIIRSACRLSNFITALFEILCVFIVTLWMIAPMVFEDPTSPLEQPLPLPASFPWDLRNTMGYSAAYIFQIITCYTTTSVIAGVDTLCVSMMIHIGAQLESLAITLEKLVESLNSEHTRISIRDISTMIRSSERKIQEKAERRETSQERNRHSGELKSHQDTYAISENLTNEDLIQEFTERELESYQKLKECIKHHNEILSFAEEVQTHFGPVMLFQCGSSTLILCFVAFLLTESSGDIGTLIKCIMYLVVGTFELWLYCVFGDRVIELSGNISNAAYGSEWIVTSRRFKKALTMMIMRAQKPIIFKGGFLYTVSLETFMSLINASYTYFTVLQQAKE